MQLVSVCYGLCCLGDASCVYSAIQTIVVHLCMYCFDLFEVCCVCICQGTALMLASLGGFHDIVEALLAAGVDLLENEQGRVN